MLTHKRIRERQAECRAAYATGSITIAAYVDIMTKLNTDLKQAEEKMYDAAGHLDQIDLLRFITGTIPAAFKKIHARFPHLTFDEVIAFEQTVREAGGSIMTHSGMFVLIQRDVCSFEGGTTHHQTYFSWSCCHSLCFRCPGPKYYKVGPYVTIDNSTRFSTHWAYVSGIEVQNPPQDSWRNCILPNDHKNHNPLSQCDNPSIFSLTDETNRCDAVASPSQKNEESIAEIESATQAQIDKIEGEISDLRRKAGHLDDLLKTLRTLSSDH